MQPPNVRSIVFAVILGALTLALSTGNAEDLQQLESGKRIKVFLFAGQSNMEGRADGNALTTEDRERLDRAQKRVQLTFNRQPVGPLDVAKPSNEIKEIYQRDTIFGPELFFGLALAEAWPDERMLFIKCAAGGTSLYGAWNPSSSCPWPGDSPNVRPRAVIFQPLGPFPLHCRCVFLRSLARRLETG